MPNLIPEEGKPAPDFAGQIQDGSRISLADFKGKKLAIYFYPRDNTPVCTVQACNLRDNFEDLKKEGISIVGVSDDPVEKHGGFASKYDLPFPLLADTEHAVMTAYGTYAEKSMFGHKYMGTKRMTFLVNEAGIIHKVIKKPKSGAHSKEIIAEFKAKPDWK